MIHCMTVGANNERIPRPADDDDFWYNDSSSGTYADSGMVVNVTIAERVAAVASCVKVISESIAQLPWIVYDRVDDRVDEAVNSGLYDVLHNAPNPLQTPFEFKEMIGVDLCYRGNSYNRIINGRRGYVDQLIRLHPDHVEVHKAYDADGLSLIYEFTNEDGQVERFTQDEIFHVRGYSDDGYVGVSPIEHFKNAVGIAVAAEQHQGVFYRNGARPLGVLQHPKPLTDAVAKRLRHSWNNVHRGAPNWAKIAILEDGMEYKDVGISAVDAQTIETRQFQIEEIARIYRVPLHMIGDLRRSTNNNIEQQSLDFVIHTLGPWMRRIEDAANRDLVVKKKTQFTKFRPEALLRGDINTRYKAYSIGLQFGFLNQDEVRAKEDMNPVPNGKGKEFRQLANLQTGGGGDNGKSPENLQ